MFYSKKKDKKNKLTSITSKGYYVPFELSIINLLNMPSVKNDLISKPVYDVSNCNDIFDGTKIVNKDENALQISVYYDDIEIANALGSGKKKHKIGNYHNYIIENKKDFNLFLK